MGLESEVGQRLQDAFLEPPQIAVQTEIKTVQVQDRIGHQLSRPVVGDVTASIGGRHLHAGFGQSSLAGDQMRPRPGTLRHRDDRRIVFDQQEIADRSTITPTGDDLVQSLPLQRKSVFIGQTAQIADDQIFRGGIRQGDRVP